MIRIVSAVPWLRTNMIVGGLLFVGQAADFLTFMLVVTAVPSLIGAETGLIVPAGGYVYIYGGGLALCLLKVVIPATLAAYMMGRECNGAFRLLVLLAAFTGFWGAASNIYALALLTGVLR